MTKRNWKVAAFVGAALAVGSPAVAQTSSGGGGGPGGTGTASSSPGVGRQGESETGVGIPATAPVDNRTLNPVQIGTGEAERSSRGGSASGTGSGFYTDLSEGNRNTATGSGGTGAGVSDTAGKVDRKLTEGLEQLHAANQAEIQAGQLAQQNASSSDVKAFGQRMVTDHGQNDQQLQDVAQTTGASLEGKGYQAEEKDSRKAASKFEGKSGSAFDRAYVDAMVKDHEKDSKDVKKLADQARKDGQSELASFLDQTEQTMQSHLTEAKQLQRSLKNAASGTASSDTSGTGDGQSE